MLAGLGGAITLFALPVIPAMIARRKNRSALGFYLFGMFCFLPAVIVALIISDDREPSGRGPSGDGQLHTPA